MPEVNPYPDADEAMGEFMDAMTRVADEFNNAHPDMQVSMLLASFSHDETVVTTMCKSRMTNDEEQQVLHGFMDTHYPTKSYTVKELGDMSWPS